MSGNLDALDAWLDDRPAASPVLVELARTLAAALDAGAGLSTAAVSREYRATLGALDDGSGGVDDDTARLFAALVDTAGP